VNWPLRKFLKRRTLTSTKLELKLQPLRISVSSYFWGLLLTEENVGSNENLPPSADKFFIADHPFVFYIKIHDVILFEGRVLVPDYE
jgi:hypothetical protein